MRGQERKQRTEEEDEQLAADEVGLVVALGNKSSEPRLNLSGSWQQGHSAAYNTPFLIQVVCK